MENIITLSPNRHANMLPKLELFTGLIIVQSAIVSVIDLNLSQTTIKSGNGYKWSAWSYDQ